MELPQLLISVEEDLPGNFAEELEREIQSAGLDLRIEPRPKMGPQAGLEWLLPTAAILYISKSYFDAFLKEMGKDHYLLLKKGLKIAWAKFFSKEKVVNISVIGTKGKTYKSKKYSLAFSIFAELDENHRIKFLLEDGLSEDAFELRINMIFDLLKALNEKDGFLDNFLASEDIRLIGKIILIAFDENKGKLVVLDPVPKK